MTDHNSIADILDLNPGQELQNFLKTLIPLDSLDDGFNESSSFITRLDSIMMAGGEFSQLVYNSCINYLVRRLITTAEYLKRKCSSDEFGLDQYPERLIEELRSFILEFTEIRGSDCEKLLILLQLCLEERTKTLKKPMKRRIRERDEINHELRCYICGISLSLSNFDEGEQHETEKTKKLEIQVDHVFPQALGGKTQEFNLKVCCNYCNQTKQDYLDSSDFHYEEICLVQDQNDKKFDVEFKKEYKIAVWSKSKYACTSCGQPASVIGRLNFARNNPKDSWHFLNISAYCDEHNPQ